MQFCVFAFATVPDVHTTRRIMQLHDLDDKSVSNVLFHRRKQQSGADQHLRWDQQMIAATSLVTHTPGSLEVTSMDLSTHDEVAMLEAFREASRQVDKTVSWGGRLFALPLVRFRSLLHAIELRQGLCEPSAEGHLDLADCLSPCSDDRPSLDDTARKLGLPGMLGRREDRMTEAWLKGNFAELQAFSALRALNSYLLALRLQLVDRRIDAAQHRDYVQRLRDLLGKQQAGHYGEFLAAWSDA